jgi:transposase-like protein
METFKHMPNVECPHCNGHQLSLVAYSFDNGTAKWSEFRCADCSTHFRVNRQYKLSEMLYTGKTRNEIAAEIQRFAAIQNTAVELHMAHAPDYYFRALSSH